MNFNNKWLWWGAGAILIMLGLTLRTASQSSRQMMTLPTKPMATAASVVPLPVLSTVAPTGPAKPDVTIIDPSAVSTLADNIQLTAPTEVVAAETPTAVRASSTACPAGQSVVEGASVWLTTNGHTFATASGRVFPSGIALTGQRVGNYCETTQTGPFGPEWVQVP